MNESLRRYRIYRQNETNYIESVRIFDHLITPQMPHNFPDYDTFSLNFNSVMAEHQKVTMISDHHAAASSLAFYGRYEWSRLEGRGISLTDYTYSLAQLMSDPLTYKAMFSSFDLIRISISWHIENGRHRALALKSLGESFVVQAELDNWIAVEVNR